MRASRSLILLTLMLASAVPAAAQTNPCTATKPAFVVVNSFSLTVAQTISEYSVLFNGAPVLTDVEVGAFAKDADPNAPTVKPLALSSTAKSAWSLVTGTADCYRATVVFPPLRDNTEYDLYARTKGALSGPWNVLADRVPFGRPGPPSAVTGLRIIP